MNKKKTKAERKAKNILKSKKVRFRKQQERHKKNIDLGRVGGKASYAIATNRIKKLGYTDFSNPDSEACILRDETAKGLREEWGREQYLGELFPKKMKENNNG